MTGYDRTSPDQTVWRTRQGELLEPKDMSSDHLKMAIAMMCRLQVRQLHSLALSALSYAGGAPDGAAYAAEGEADRLFDEAADPKRVLDMALARYAIVRLMFKELEARAKLVPSNN